MGLNNFSFQLRFLEILQKIPILTNRDYFILLTWLFLKLHHFRYFHIVATDQWFLVDVLGDHAEFGNSQIL